MCSGRVDLEFILRAFANGMDGVFIGGTHGNYNALNTALLCRQIMAHIGLNPARLRIEFMSSGEGMLFTDIMDAFSADIKALGPIGRSDDVSPDELPAKLDAVRKLVPYIKLAKRDKLEQRLQNTEEREMFFSRDEIDQMFREVTSYYIDPEKCQACMICYRKCPVDAIDGGKNRIHVIDQDTCIKCGTCLEACPPRFDAVRRISGQPVPDAIPEEERRIARRSRA